MVKTNWARPGPAHYHQTHATNGPLIVEVCFQSFSTGTLESLSEFPRSYSTFLLQTLRFDRSKVLLQSLFLIRSIDFRSDSEKMKENFDRKILTSRA